jgi:hypothetical protein
MYELVHSDVMPWYNLRQVMARLETWGFLHVAALPHAFAYG